MAHVPLTISLPIYNAERYLTECVESIKAQTFGDFEVYCVLDGCTDRSEQILMDLKDARFTIHRKPTNEGIVPALNYILEHAAGDLIARFDADDIMVPQRLAVQLEYLAGHPDVDILGSWFDYIDEEGRVVREAERFPQHHVDIKAGFRQQNCIGGPATIYRKADILRDGGYDPDFPIGEDLTLWLKCLANGLRFANLPQVLVHYRLHATQSSGKGRRRMLELTDRAYALYGPRIWGEDAPEFHLSDPLWKRGLRKIGKTLKARQ